MRTISKPLFLPLLFLLAAAWGALDAHAAMIPQEWSVEVARIKQYQFEANRGDTMELKATFWHKGEPFDLGGDTFRLYWQTNGMDSVYWSVPAVSASNTVSAVFANTMDPGAPIVYGFLGATSGNYRAAFAIRYAPGPGAAPNALPLPAKSIDFAQVEVFNAPWLLPGATNDIGAIKVELGSISNSVSTLSAATATNTADIATLNDTTSTLSDTTATNTADIATINSKIPSTASASNQLADKQWIDDEIDTYAAYYITYTAAGAAFPTRAALLNATVVYSGGAARTPTRNDYAVVLADESHAGAEWRYIYTVAAGATSGQWDAQYPIETNDYDGLSNKPQINGVLLSGNKTGADLGVLDLAGGMMTPTFVSGQIPSGKVVFGADAGGPYIGMAYGQNYVMLRPQNVALDGRNTALAAANPTAGNLAALDANGNPTDSLIPATSVATKSMIDASNTTFSNAVLSVGLGIDTNTVAVINELVDSAHDLPVTGATSVGALLLALAAAVAALKKNLRYSYNAATVSSGTTPTVTDVADRAINTATLGSSVTAATVTLPAATTGRARDFFIDLTIEATTAPTLTFIDPATNTTANVTFGADSLADIDTGKNAVLFTEFPNYTWIVSVKHEEVSA